MYVIIVIISIITSSSSSSISNSSSSSIVTITIAIAQRYTPTHVCRCSFGVSASAAKQIVCSCVYEMIFISCDARLEKSGEVVQGSMRHGDVRRGKARQRLCVREFVFGATACACSCSEMCLR